MTKDEKQTRANPSIKHELHILTIGVLIPFVVMIISVIFMLESFNAEYTIILKNITTASEFNFDFKENMDLNMYHYVVGSAEMDHLPLEEVREARTVIKRLKKTTTKDENIWRVKSLLRLCDRLSECMISIKRADSYDSRKEQLEKDIYVLTGLIDTYMSDYIHDEVKDLSALQKKIQKKVELTILATFAVSTVLLIFMIWYTIHISRNITVPVQSLCEKVEKLGEGDFEVMPIAAKNVEFSMLDEGFNDMAVRINTLVENVKENQDALRMAELELLQAQINPHFLYNTLDSIIWLAEAHLDGEVIDMTYNLSTFFRNSLSKGKDVITLEVEKQQVESYLKIQQIRYSDILEYEIHIPEELLQYAIPKLTLQPLVENALYHGVKNKRSTGHIIITGKETEEDLLIEVHDDGAGMSKEQLEELRSGIYEDRHTGLGLLNVHKRLILYCGRPYGLEFESELGKGTTVTVRIPKKFNFSHKKFN